MTSLATGLITERIDVDLGERAYPIHIGQDLLTNAHSYLEPHLRGSKIAIITDENIAPLHLQALKSGLEGNGLHITVIILPAGESTKSFAHLQGVLAQLLAENFSRSDTLIAFGGGVIGDLTGFAASMLKRGCGFIQIPTTLLAQVDSSVGGKTAINTKAGKNLVGSFYQPRCVLTDLDVLQTLPKRELKAGYGEVLKYGLIDSPDFFGWLEANGQDVIAGKVDALQYATAYSCCAKAAIVKADEREHGRRALLNLGHSFAHAIEGMAGYDGTVLHGEAVSAGMLMAFEYSQEQGLCSGQDAERVRKHLQKLNLETMATLPPMVRENPQAFFDFMMRDKKNKQDGLTLILAHGIGKAFIKENTDKNSVQAFVNTACKGPKT